MEVDTGAASTILNTQLFREIQRNTKCLDKNNLPVLRTYSGVVILSPGSGYAKCCLRRTNSQAFCLGGAEHETVFAWQELASAYTD